MKVISLDECCQIVDKAFETNKLLKTADIKEMLNCSLPTARKIASAMLAMGIMYEVNGFKGRRFTKVTPEERSAEHLREYRQRTHLIAEAKKQTRTLVFLCNGRTREGNQIFESCRQHNRLLELDNLLRSTGKFH